MEIKRFPCYFDQIINEQNIHITTNQEKMGKELDEALNYYNRQISDIQRQMERYSLFSNERKKLKAKSDHLASLRYYKRKEIMAKYLNHTNEDNREELKAQYTKEFIALAKSKSQNYINHPLLVESAKWISNIFFSNIDRINPNSYVRITSETISFNIYPNRITLYTSSNHEYQYNFVNMGFPAFFNDIDVAAFSVALSGYLEFLTIGRYPTDKKGGHVRVNVQLECERAHASITYSSY